MLTKYRTTQIACTAGLFILLSLVVSGTVYAQGRALIKPHIETGYQRDSNFHKSQTTEREVDTFYVKPGIELGYTTDKTLVSLDYWAKILKYDDKDDNVPAAQKADRFDYTEHMADFTAQTQATERLQLGIDNLFWKTRDPANADAASNAVDRWEYTLNKFTPRMLYNFGDKFGLGLKYTNLMTDYKDDAVGQGEDSDENRGTLTFYYYFNSKTSFDLDYQYWQRDYDKTSEDYDSNQIMVNVNRQFNYFTMGAGAGYQNRDFSNEANVTGGDQSQFVWKAYVMGQNPPDATSKPKSYMYVSVGNNLNDNGAGDSYYTSTRVDAVFSYLFMERLKFTLDGYYQNSDYETSTREDDRWYAALAVDYYMFNDILSIGVKGGMEERDSNDNTKDFDNDFVMVNVKIAYDMGSK